MKHPIRFLLNLFYFEIIMIFLPFPSSFLFDAKLSLLLGKSDGSYVCFVNVSSSENKCCSPKVGHSVLVCCVHIRTCVFKSSDL